MSMGRQDWRTPAWLFDTLSARFGPFRLDAAASDQNALCDRYHTAEYSGLDERWLDQTFCNPPFAQAGEWAARARAELCREGVRSVLILPAGCSQRWWHDHVLGCDQAQVFYPDRRICFDLPDGSPSSSADRDTVIVAYGYGPQAFRVMPVREHLERRRAA